MLAGILYTTNTNLKVFDPNAELIDRMRHLSFDNDVANLLQQQGIDTVNTVVHFRDDNCICNFIAKPHINSVKALAEYSAKKNIVVAFNEIADIASIIPSVPAVAVFDELGALSYLGPYSTGMYCSPNRGIVEPFIRAKDQAFRPDSATIIAEAKGCYCLLTPSET